MALTEWLEDGGFKNHALNNNGLRAGGLRSTGLQLICFEGAYCDGVLLGMWQWQTALVLIQVMALEDRLKL